jgi:hypothetical protein
MDTPRPASGHPRLVGIAAALLLLPLAASVGGNPARAD